ncbi:MAG: hypothetical protein ABR561_00780 [Guyparkeria sp.]
MPRTVVARRASESLLAFGGWWLTGWAVSHAFPAVADYLPISLPWAANALAYSAVLSLGPRLIPAFTLAALTWNVARDDALHEIVIGTGAFLVVMLFVTGFSRLRERRVEQAPARRLLRVPIIASASVFTLLGVWQFVGSRAANYRAGHCPVAVRGHLGAAVHPAGPTGHRRARPFPGRVPPVPADYRRDRRLNPDRVPGAHGATAGGPAG